MHIEQVKTKNMAEKRNFLMLAIGLGVIGIIIGGITIWNFVSDLTEP
jgi:hypothetical protein